eukprot:830965-Amphidinium_carterae.1
MQSLGLNGTSALDGVHDSCHFRTRLTFGQSAQATRCSNSKSLNKNSGIAKMLGSLHSTRSN